jgi:hypothetical protein
MPVPARTETSLDVSVHPRSEIFRDFSTSVGMTKRYD